MPEQTQKLIGFIKLLRPVNLLIMVATAFAMRYGILRPIYERLDNAPFQLSFFDFSLLTLVLVLLAGAGNVINDYFDVKVDRVNKPDKIIVGRTVKRRVAMMTHHVFNFIALIICGYLGWKHHQYWFVFAPLPFSITLWLYSFWLKRIPFLGNLIVAIFVGFVPIWSVWFELIPMHDEYPYFGAFLLAMPWIIGFSIFGFILTIQREVQKDVQDLSGDKMGGFKTLPVLWGIRKVKKYILLVESVVLITMGYATYELFNIGFPMGNFGFVIWCCLICVPQIINIYFTFSAVNRSHFARLSRISKLTMAGGLLFVIIISMHLG